LNEKDLEDIKVKSYEILNKGEKQKPSFRLNLTSKSLKRLSSASAKSLSTMNKKTRSYITQLKKRLDEETLARERLESQLREIKSLVYSLLKSSTQH